MTTVSSSAAAVPRRSPRLLAAGVAGAAFLLVLALRLWLKWVGPLPGDRWAEFNLGNVHLEQPWRDLGTFFSVIGGPPVAFATVVCSTWFVARAGGARAVAFVALACCGVAANAVLKVLSGPTPLMIQKLGYTDALNYPSGHTVYAVVFFGSLATLAWIGGRRDVCVVLVALVLAMGPARVVADAHFVSDVVAGYLVGAGWLICAALVTRPAESMRRSRQGVPLPE